jgi:hypothetical protein
MERLAGPTQQSGPAFRGGRCGGGLVWAPTREHNMSEAPLRVLVTGARKTTRQQDALVTDVLTRLCANAMEHRKIVVMEGECPTGGVDLAARKWADGHDIMVISEPHPADWTRYGKKAGMIRNAEMVAAGADICLAFPGNASVGTWDCIRKAADAGIHVRIYPLGETP